MWTAIIKSAIYLAAITFLMWVLAQVLGMVVPIATAGPYASNPTVQTIKGYFDAMTVENLTALGGLSVGAYLLGRAVVERRIVR